MSRCDVGLLCGFYHVCKKLCLLWWEPRLERLCLSVFRLICLCCYVFSPVPTLRIFHMLMAEYSLFVLKVPLNTNKPNTHMVGNICEFEA